MKFLARKIIAILFITLAGASLSLAQTTYTLFRENRMNIHYDEFVTQFQDGDILKFSDGKQFTIDKVLGHGSTTLVLSFKEDPTKALRIPLRERWQNYINDYIKGYRAIHDSHIPAIQVYESYPNEYIVVEKLKGSFYTFRDFIEKTSRSKMETLVNRIFGKSDPLSSLPHEEMVQKFTEFAEKIYAFSNVGDMHQDNLIYDVERKEWRLMDWINQHESALYFEHNTVQFKDTAPINSLLTRYGFFRDGRFHSLGGKKYAWLETLAANAMTAIREQRSHRAGRSVWGMMCSQIFL